MLGVYSVPEVGYDRVHGKGFAHNPELLGLTGRGEVANGGHLVVEASHKCCIVKSDLVQADDHLSFVEHVGALVPEEEAFDSEQVVVVEPAPVVLFLRLVDTKVAHLHIQALHISLTALFGLDFVGEASKLPAVDHLVLFELEVGDHDEHQRLEQEEEDVGYDNERCTELDIHLS